jgi:hypothetical protein
MSENKFEKDTLKQINKLDEGFFASLVKGLFFNSAAKRSMKKAQKIAKDDPEIQSALKGLEYHQDQIRDLIKNMCKRNPDHPTCKK